MTIEGQSSNGTAAAVGEGTVLNARRATSALPLAGLLVGAVMWGLTWWPLQSLHALGIGGVPLTLVSYGAGGLLLALAAWWQRASWRGHQRALGVILFIGGYTNLAYILAIVNGNPTRVMLLFYLAPIWALLGVRFFLGERLDAIRIIAVFVAVLGAFLVIGGPGVVRTPPSNVDLLAISSGFCYAMTNIAYRATTAVPVSTKNAAMFLGSVLIALALLPVIGQDIGTIPAAGWAWGALFGLIWLVTAVGMTQFGVTHLEAGRSAILLMLEVPITAVSAALIAGARLTVMEAIGGLLIMGAAMLEALRQR